MWFPEYKGWFSGAIEKYNPDTKLHTMNFDPSHVDNGGLCELKLKDQRIRWLT